MRPHATPAQGVLDGAGVTGAAVAPEPLCATRLLAGDQVRNHESPSGYWRSIASKMLVAFDSTSIRKLAYHAPFSVRDTRGSRRSDGDRWPDCSAVGI
jgi:hypothetical protein